MKKYILAAICGLFLLLCFWGCGCQHKWIDATCTAPKHCTKCGETRGHALGHDVKEWKPQSSADDTDIHAEIGVCIRCGKIVDHTALLAEHSPSDWLTIVNAGSDTPELRIKICTVCGKELERESYPTEKNAHE